MLSRITFFWGIGKRKRDYDSFFRGSFARYILYLEFNFVFFLVELFKVLVYRN